MLNYWLRLGFRTFATLSRFALPLRLRLEGKMHLGIKNKQVYFVLPSVFITFAPIFEN